MDNLDRMIAQALSEGDDTNPEPGYFALAFSIFGGKQGWVTWVIMVMQIAMFAAAIWAGWHFFNATEVLSALKWGLSAATLLLMGLQVKLSLMPVMQANRVLLAIRRLEKRLARDG